MIDTDPSDPRRAQIESDLRGLLKRIDIEIEDPDRVAHLVNITFDYCDRQHQREVCDLWIQALARISVTNIGGRWYGTYQRPHGSEETDTAIVTHPRGNELDAFEAALTWMAGEPLEPYRWYAHPAVLGYMAPFRADTGSIELI